MKRIFACMLVLALMLIGTAWAANVVSPGEDFYYLDTADVLDEETEGILYFCNRQLEEACGGQIVVAALDSIDGADIYDYAYDLFNEWGIGSAEENNGFLLLMAIAEDNYYALTGSGIDGVLSSSVLKEMNDEYLEPDFAEKDYDAGALKYFEAVLDKYNDYYNLNITIESGKSAYESYMQENSSASDLGGASGVIWHEDEFFHHDSFHRAGFFDLIWDSAASVIGVIVLIVVLSIIFGGRGGSFRRFSFFPIFNATRRRWQHQPHRHHNPHGHHQHHRTPPTGGFGGAGRSTRSGGFGGSRGGGGRSFGGGAGRGRR